MMRYVKVNKEPIDINYMPDEDDQYNYQPSFIFNSCRYWLKDFIRIKNSPWVKEEFFPDYIDAFNAYEIYLPLYLHLIDDCQVDVYIQIGDDS